MKIWKRFGFWGGIIGCGILLVWPGSSLPPLAGRGLAITMLMAVWWITQAVSIPVTALVPLVLFPLFKVMTMEHVSLNYINHYIFLFMGGFMMALAIEKWG